MELLSKAISSFKEKLSGQIGDSTQFSGKKWITYSVLLVISLILFLAVGGSKRRIPDALPAGDEELSSSIIFRSMTDKMAGLGKTDSPGIDWETVPEEVVPLYRSWGRDPFVTNREYRVSREGASPDLHLSAISWKNGQGIVLINDSILKKGESVDGAEVEEIYSRSVVLIKGGERIILGLNGGG